MSRRLTAQALTAEAFAPFGSVIEARGAPDFLINSGRCGRHHDLARPEVRDGALALSVGRSEAVALPMTLDLMERHPLGSQAFVPMAGARMLVRMLVTVAPDEGGRPGRPLAFVSGPGQGVQYALGCWHGVLAPLDGPADFLIVDRVGEGPNLEEHRFERPWTVEAS